MEIIESETDLRLRIKTLKNSGLVIGFVPTMGSLHKGHLSLIKIARKYCDVVVCSIYVNPTQFNEQKDFESYPKNLESDIKMLKNSGCDFTFVPENSTIYPSGVKQVEYNIGELGKVMEGKFRNGHFNGVIQVVKRFFDIVEPDVAIFGLKDFQQLAVIRWMVDHFNLGIKIIGAPIVRDPDGLAMSSRNVRLSESERKIALNLSKTLDFIRKNYKNNTVFSLKKDAINRLNKIDGLDVEYLEIADITMLQPVSVINESLSTGVFVAAKVGQVRLIDNVVLF